MRERTGLHAAALALAVTAGFAASLAATVAGRLAGLGTLEAALLGGAAGIGSYFLVLALARPGPGEEGRP